MVNYTYRAFGEQLKRLDKSNNPTEDVGKYSYSGKELDEDINLYYFNQRYYDATTGRFINVDPIQDQQNWYVYCLNNPLSMVDPTGLTVEDVGASLHQQDVTPDENGNDRVLGDSGYTIEGYGCVLTSYLRIASAIGGEEYSLEQANDMATEMGLYTDDGGLSTKAGAQLIGALTGEEIGYHKLSGSSNDVIDALQRYDSSDNSYYATGRIQTTNASGTQTYQHHVNINETASEINIGNRLSVNSPQPIVDTSNVNRTSTGVSAGRSNQLLRADLFLCEVSSGKYGRIGVWNAKYNIFSDADVSDCSINWVFPV